MGISYQLYSARNAPPLSAVLADLARIGYRQVEGYGGLYGDLDGLADGLAANGLSMPTAHFGLDLLKDVERATAIAERLGIGTLYCPAVPQADRSQNEAGWRALADTLAGLQDIYAGRGFSFGWHNHDFEFRPTETGALPIDIILGASPDLLWEMDVAWLVRSGQEPEPWLQRFGDRIKAIHVKDMAPEGEALDEDGWADVGHGVMDWPAIIEAVRRHTAASVFVMEHDNPSDATRFAERSYATAKLMIGE